MAKSEQAMGMECEQEHDWLTKEERLRLVQDHLKENPAYYSMLEELEEDDDDEEEDEDKPDDELVKMSPKEYSEYRNKRESKKKGKK